MKKRTMMARLRGQCAFALFARLAFMAVSLNGFALAAEIRAPMVGAFFAVATVFYGWGLKEAFTLWRATRTLTIREDP